MFDLFHYLITCSLLGFLAFLVAQLLPNLVREMRQWHIEYVQKRPPAGKTAPEETSPPLLHALAARHAHPAIDDEGEDL